MFMLSFPEKCKRVRIRLNFYRSRIFGKISLQHAILYANPKDEGKLEVEVLEIKNRCLLSKWISNSYQRRVCGWNCYITN
jgi:hypothetical protein